MCPFVPRLKRDPNVKIEMKDASTQVDMDDNMRLSLLPCGTKNHRMGCRESYA